MIGVGELLAHNDDAAVLVVLGEGLDGVAEGLYGHAVGSDTLLLESLGHLLGTGLGIAHVDSWVAGATVGVTLDADALVGILVAPLYNSAEYDIG